MNRWDAFFYGPVAAVRPYLLTKAVLLFLAFDAWVAMTRFGAHYGAAGFNVSHFAWLDRLQPTPTPGWHVAVLLLSGLLSLTLVLAGTSRLGLVCLWGLYTYSWSMSRLDSYTHHYLITILLAAFVVFPDLRAEELCRPGRDRPRVSAWAYALVGATVGIVFFYCAMAKVDSQWRSGHTLLSMGGPEQLYGPIQSWLERFGLTRSVFWAVLSSSVIVLELALAVAYPVAVRQDAISSRALRVGAPLAWVLAMGLHIGNEFLRLEIRWFSYYMILVGCVFFLPEGVLLTVVRLVQRPVAAVAVWCRERIPIHRSEVTGLLAVMASATLLLAGRAVDLPGSRTVGWISAGVVATAWLASAARGQAAATARWLAASGLAAVAMWGTIASSSARDHFYRYLGDDLVLLDRPREALLAYRRAVDYAPRQAVRLAEVHHNMSTVWIRLGDKQAALHHLRQAVAQDPQRIGIRKELALALRRAGDLTSALEEYQQVIEQAPDDVEALTELGVVSRRLGQVDEALDYFQRALQLDPESAGAHYNLGNALLEQEQFAAAAGHFQQAIAAEPDLAEAHNNLGIACFRLGRYREAAQAFERTLAIRPDYGDASRSLEHVRKLMEPSTR